MIAAAIDIGTATAQTYAAGTGTVNFGTLDTFSGPNGGYPETGLIQATNGNLYGSTAFEAPISGGNGSSTIFEMTPSGVLTTVFAPGSTGNPCQDGDYPVGIVQANNGYIFGAMTGEGAYGAGTIFKMTPAGTFTTLYNFCPDYATCDDGKFPVGLVQAANGDLYGTTQWGGLYNRGTVFKITASGIFTSIYSFCLQEPCADGAPPLAGLVQEANGDLVGTTEYGGTVACCSSFYYPMAVARSSKKLRPVCSRLFTTFVPSRLCGWSPAFNQLSGGTRRAPLWHNFVRWGHLRLPIFAVFSRLWNHLHHRS